MLTLYYHHIRVNFVTYIISINYCDGNSDNNNDGDSDNNSDSDYSNISHNTKKTYT